MKNEQCARCEDDIAEVRLTATTLDGEVIDTCVLCRHCASQGTEDVLSIGTSYVRPYEHLRGDGKPRG